MDDAGHTATTHPTSQHDVVIVGARCAGAATAMLLAQQGLDVLLVDRAEFPSDTLSTHAISRGGMVQLQRWGLLDEVMATGAPPIHRLAFWIDDDVVVKPLKSHSGVDHLAAPRRHLLDQVLVNAAVNAGATLRTGITVTGILESAPGQVEGVTARDASGAPVTFRAATTVGADGVWSRIARSVGAATYNSRPSEGATHYAYFSGLELDGFEFHLGPESTAGVFPTNDGEGCVWVCTPAERVEALRGDREGGFLTLIENTSRSLASRLARANRTAPIRGAVAFPNHFRQPWGPGWALVGDAGYHRDPVSGHGITDAFRDAELLARALGEVARGERDENQAMASYQHQRDELAAEVFDATCVMATYPGVDEFVRQQRRVSRAIDREAQFLANLPALPAQAAAVAA